MFSPLLYFSNTKGGYAAFSGASKTKYEGVFFYENGEMYKILESLSPLENIDFSYEGNTFSWENPNEEVEIRLDMRKSYDTREFGREYFVEEKGGDIFIHFAHSNEYSLSLKISLFGARYSLKKQWEKVEYEKDKERGEKGEWYVYSLLRTSAKKGECTFSVELSSAFSLLKKKREERVPLTSFFQKKRSAIEESLLSLFINEKNTLGIFAGHPWFFQFWTRDTAISAKGLSLAGKKKEAKKILLDLLKNIDHEGRIPNRFPASDLGSADGVGWVFFRLYELFQKGDLSRKEKKVVLGALENSLSSLEKTYFKDGVITNNRLETWMDTGYKDDVRTGSRIEIQALTLAMYRFAFSLSQNPAWKKKEEEMQKSVREYFWNGEYLKDGSDDETIRPNIFLAFYVYPELLLPEEQEQCFDVALEKLWLSWGGLSTIDTSNPLFCREYSGMNNKSYHRGDSWYFVNNIAAMCLHRLHPEKYNRYIQKICSASEKDFYELGAKNGSSEVSSAAKQTSEGCFHQAWSCATLIELLEEVR